MIADGQRPPSLRPIIPMGWRIATVVALVLSVAAITLPFVAPRPKRPAASQRGGDAPPLSRQAAPAAPAASAPPAPRPYDVVTDPTTPAPVAPDLPLLTPRPGRWSPSDSDLRDLIQRTPEFLALPEHLRPWVTQWGPFTLAMELQTFDLNVPEASDAMRRSFAAAAATWSVLLNEAVDRHRHERTAAQSPDAAGQRPVPTASDRREYAEAMARFEARVGRDLRDRWARANLNPDQRERWARAVAASQNAPESVIDPVGGTDGDGR